MKPRSTRLIGCTTTTAHALRDAIFPRMSAGSVPEGIVCATIAPNATARASS
jgi:hypothetical protein